MAEKKRSGAIAGGGRPFAKGERPPVGRPFQPGHDPRRELARERAGRKPDAFVAECARLADEDLLPKLREKLQSGTPDDAAWRWAAERVLEYSKRKAAQAVEVTMPDAPPPPPGRLSPAEVEAEVRRILTARSN